MCIVDLHPHAPVAVPGRPGCQWIRNRRKPSLGSLLSCLLMCAACMTGMVKAHPVSLGALDVVVSPDHINLYATVSCEEILVAAIGNKQEEPLNAEGLRLHGDYLLSHFRVTADGSRLPGRVVKVPEYTVRRATYALQYQMTGIRPARIVIEQDVLREFEFAPGNRWEASYLARIGIEDQPSLEGVLLTSKEPLKFDCRWPAAADAVGAPKLNKARMAAVFLRHGVMHVLTGYDHLLFIGALLLALTTVWDLVKVVSAFTLAHTITLTLAALDVFRLPGRIVEPMIAASIILVAIQNVFWPKRSRGWTQLLVVFFFGLFHGLGFAGGLIEVMSSMRLAVAAMAIAAFSIGVEIGHQVVILPVFCGLRHLNSAYAKYTGASGHGWLIRRYSSAAISIAGMVYLVAALR